MESTKITTEEEYTPRTVGGSVTTDIFEVDFDHLCRVQEAIKKFEARQVMERLEVPIISNKIEERKDYTRKIADELKPTIIESKIEERKDYDRKIADDLNCPVIESKIEKRKGYNI